MGYSTVEEIYEDEGKEKLEVKNDYISVEEMSVVELDVKKSRFFLFGSCFFLFQYYNLLLHV